MFGIDDKIIEEKSDEIDRLRTRLALMEQFIIERDLWREFQTAISPKVPTGVDNGSIESD